MVSANQALTKIDLMIDADQEINLDFLKKVFSKDVDFEASNLVDYSIVVPSNVTARIQEMHILIGHTICHLIDQAFIEHPIE